MELILNITSYHRLSPEIEATKTVTDSLTFGRSEACDWHLPDPEKIISSKHGIIEKEGDSFYVYDNSTNGLFINFAVAPLGQGNKQRLSDSDVLTIGDFQVNVVLTSDQQADVSSSAPSHFQSVDTFATQNSQPAEQSIPSFDDSIMNESMPEISVTAQQTTDNHIPEDWDELTRLMNTDDFDIGNNVSNSSAPVDTPAPAPIQEPPRSNSHANEHKPDKQSAPIKSVVQNDKALSDAFLKGLGIKDELKNSLDNEKLWFEMGQGLNLLLTELMESLRQRAIVKNKLRLNHTMFQAEQNNPLKFSANIDDVIQNLFIKNSASFLSSNESIKESFIDTRKHEHALLAGADGVLKGMLSQVSPMQINQQANDNSNVLKIIPGQIESKCWKLYQSLYDDISQEVNTKGAMAMSDDFLKAYNDRIKETH
ncbi:type VI secretion system-associated FHA domain protein TagH [Pseudoalteromonas sp. US3C1013]|uniref:type VI secretion system-associated FHA domain protein TagH n=1 Tax=unclassified Pseudoalteromonas TaxID=194690 RepID=UPI003AB33775